MVSMAAPLPCSTSTISPPCSSSPELHGRYGVASEGEEAERRGQRNLGPSRTAYGVEGTMRSLGPPWTGGKNGDSSRAAQWHLPIPEAQTTLHGAPAVTAGRLIRAILVLVGAGFVFARPFPVSPMACLEAFPLSSLLGNRNVRVRADCRLGFRVQFAGHASPCGGGDVIGR